MDEPAFAERDEVFRAGQGFDPYPLVKVIAAPLYFGMDLLPLPLVVVGDEEAGGNIPAFPEARPWFNSLLWLNSHPLQRPVFVHLPGRPAVPAAEHRPLTFHAELCPALPAHVQGLVQAFRPPGKRDLKFRIALVPVVVIGQFPLHDGEDLLCGHGRRLFRRQDALERCPQADFPAGGQVPYRRLQVVAVHHERDDGHPEQAGKLGEREGQAGVRPDVGIARFGVDDDDVAPVNDLLDVPHERQVADELARSQASHLPVYPFAECLEAFQLGDVVCPVRPHGKRGHVEVHEGMVRAEQEVGRLDARHVFLPDFQPVADGVEPADQVHEGKEEKVLPRRRHFAVKGRGVYLPPLPCSQAAPIVASVRAYVARMYPAAAFGTGGMTTSVR